MKGIKPCRNIFISLASFDRKCIVPGSPVSVSCHDVPDDAIGARLAAEAGRLRAGPN